MRRRLERNEGGRGGVGIAHDQGSGTRPAGQRLHTDEARLQRVAQHGLLLKLSVRCEMGRCLIEMQLWLLMLLLR